MVGLTTEVAYLRLVNDVRSVLNASRSVVRYPLSFNEKIDFLVGGGILAALAFTAIVVERTLVRISIIVELLIYLPSLLLLFYITYRQRTQAAIFAQEKVKDIIDRFEEDEDRPNDGVNLQGVPLASTATMVSILRDGKWSPFPSNIIVESDHFRLHPGASFPVNSKEVRISGYSGVLTGEEFTSGEIWNPEDNTPGHFVALGTVAAAQVQKYLQLNSLQFGKALSENGRSKNDRSRDCKRFGAANTVFAELAQMVRVRLLQLFLVAILIASISCAIWISMFDFSDDVDSFLLSDTLLAIIRIASCFACVMPRLLFLFTDAWGTARVSAFVEWHAGTVQGVHSKGDNQHAKGENLDPARVPWRAIARELSDAFFEIGTGRNLLHTLNGVTVLAFCDKEGLLTDTCRSVCELAIMQAPDPQASRQWENMPQKHDSPPATDDEPALTPVILDILVDSKRFPECGFRFEDASWAHYISSLKPLALAMAVSRQPRHQGNPALPQLQISDAMQMLTAGLEVLQDCLCGASRLIGMRDTVAQSFRILYVSVHVSHTKEQITDMTRFGTGMMQWFVRDTRDQSVQMFCKGPGHDVIERCSHYFAGNQIHRLTQKDKQVLSNLMLQWGSSGSLAVGYSYRPVLDFDQYDHLNAPDDDGRRNSSGILEELILEKDNDLPRNQFLKPYANNHILLGLAALKISVSVEVPRYLAKVKDAGIRFCLFSPVGDKKTRTTGALLGLETGWNCLIALEPKPEEKVQKNLMGQVVLPSGIDEIRNHIETVDNVPLLVSMFSRATSRTTHEMIKILQEHGECVVLIGSALKPENFELFNQANSSVSVLVGAAPLCSNCAGFLEPGAEGPRDVMVPREIQLSAELTGLPCALQASHSFSEGEQRTICVVVHAIKEARRSVDSIFLSLVFFTCSVMILAFLFVLKALVNVPSPISGIHLAVCISFELPLLSLCLLWNQAHDGIMKEFPFKKADEKMHSQPDRMIALYSVRSLPTAIVLFSLYLIQLNHAWEKELEKAQVDECAGFNFAFWLSGRWIACWNAWRSESEAPDVMLVHAQLTTGWLFSLYLIIFSAGFLNRCASLFSAGLSNRLWLMVCLLIVAVYSTIVAVRLFAYPGSVTVVAPPIKWFLLATVWCFFVVGLNEWVKFKDRRFHLESQKYLQVLFSTRLGMWSPR